MLELMKHLWRDEVGSSQSTEMALVTGVTVGAMIMGMRSFGDAVNSRFTKMEIQDNTVEQLEQQIEAELLKKQQTEEQRLQGLRQRRQEQLDRKRQQSLPETTVSR